MLKQTLMEFYLGLERKQARFTKVNVFIWDFSSDKNLKTIMRRKLWLRLKLTKANVMAVEHAKTLAL